MILLKGRLWQAHSEPPSAEAQNVRAPYTTAIFLGERIRPPSPAALLLVNVFLTYIVIAVCVCVCLRGRACWCVCLCAHMCLGMCATMLDCGGVSLCALMRLSVFVFFVCVVVHVCVSVCLCVCMRGKDYCMASAWLPHGPNHIFEISPTWQGAWPHFPSARLGSANPWLPLLNH